SLLFALPLLTTAITTFYMFRMWFLTFTGEPRDHHVHEHAHESPWPMTVPLIVLAFFSVVVSWPWLRAPDEAQSWYQWSWPVSKPEPSHLEAQIHHAQHPAVIADFGRVAHDPFWSGKTDKPPDLHVRYKAEESHGLAGILALLAAVLGAVFASMLYFFRVMD